MQYATFSAAAPIEFPNKEAARTWYNSTEYQAALPMRLNATRSSLLLFPGD